MKCIYCEEATRVVDSRESKDGEAVRRRRECTQCSERFTTYERAQLRRMDVKKHDGRTEPFDRDKLAQGIQRACEKRPISEERIHAIITAVEEEIQALHEPVVESKTIGEKVCQRLREEDEVAYLRFASVYKEFTDGAQFVRELDDLSDKRHTEVTQ